METERIRLDMAGAERLVAMLNAGGWVGVGPRYRAGHGGNQVWAVPLPPLSAEGSGWQHGYTGA